MSSDSIITVENLGKKYLLRHQKGQRYTALRDVIADRAKNLFRRNRPVAGPTREEFWALKDVSFEVKRGEVLGIIGRNGAGKTTLLKILSRITDPTEGRVRLRGRVASLLEVGTGFHPELTGRENIFLNGAILGMTRAEIKSKFDEIVDFAEIERFLDTPVKRYSSGMYVRLAFAVAAHLEPEILLVDEVLAVGDAEFQRKCLGKMHDVARGGRTVLFVSHNMAPIATLTQRALLINCGNLLFEGPSANTIEKYLGTLSRGAGFHATYCDQKVHQVLDVTIPSLEETGAHVSGQPLRIRVTIRSRSVTQRGCLSIQIINQNLSPVLHLRAYDQGVFFGKCIGTVILECEVPDCRLNVGTYSLNLYLSGPPSAEFFERIQGVCSFDVEVRSPIALFGWRPDACAYIVNESWVSHS